ncbi:MAG: protein-disulfide reductase DsbD domain-containing protein [Acidimicrobiales bacterium]
MAAVDGSSPGVRFAAWLDTDVLYANQLQEVHVRFDLDPGVHLYTDPVPDGFRALTVGLGGDERVQADIATPETGQSFGVTGLDEEFHVVDGQVDLTVPFFLLSNRDTAGDDARPVALDVEVSYQACTDEECFMPERQVLRLDLTEEPNPGYETTDLAALSPLVMRRIVEAPKSMDDLMHLVNAALTGTSASEGQIGDALAALEERGLIAQLDDGRWEQA